MEQLALVPSLMPATDDFLQTETTAADTVTMQRRLRKEPPHEKQDGSVGVDESNDAGDGCDIDDLIDAGMSSPNDDDDDDGKEDKRAAAGGAEEQEEEEGVDRADVVRLSTSSAVRRAPARSIHMAYRMAFMSALDKSRARIAASDAKTPAATVDDGSMVALLAGTSRPYVPPITPINILRRRRGRRPAAATAAHKNNNNNGIASNGLVNQDFCAACHQSGQFICCETCPKSYHFTCAEPPFDMDELAHQDKWYCRGCLNAKKPPPTRPQGIFHQLLTNMDHMLPVVFSLPKDIKSFYAGVSWDPETGNYQDNNDVKQVRMRYGVPIEHDLFRITTEDGHPVQCHRCSKSSRQGPIIICDYCALAWHLDCLNPPATAPPPANKKWMCPAHAYHSTPKLRKVEGSLNYITIDDPRQPNDGDIEVVLDANLSAASDAQDEQRTKYVLPEESIKLSFLEKAARMRAEVQDEEVPNHPENPTVHDSACSFSFTHSEAWLTGLQAFAEEVARFIHSPPDKLSTLCDALQAVENKDNTTQSSSRTRSSTPRETRQKRKKV